jgi:SAM-dependent methyltransferase
MGAVMADKAQLFYDSRFYETYSDGSGSSASVVLPIVRKIVDPRSVLDVGCGVGTWLAEWVSQGVTDVVGLDGDYVDRAMLQIASDKFVPTNLQVGFSLGRKFDLVESLEVAEHLDEAYADLFVKSLTSHGDVILFSAAIPGQGGRHHVNEQWPSYWIGKFAEAGFKSYDALRPLIWTDRRVARWYRQNILIFAKERVFEGSQICPDLVHPEIWQHGISYDRHPVEVVRSFPVAVKALVREKLGLSYSR